MRMSPESSIISPRRARFCPPLHGLPIDSHWRNSETCRYSPCGEPGPVTIQTTSALKQIGSNVSVVRREGILLL
jgi:hypothetical protein